MKYLSIDYGTKRVGLALSDDTASLAFPLSVVKNDKDLLAHILGLIEKEKIDALVIGESLNFKGQPNPLMKDINNFIKNIKEKTKIPIIFEPEFLTSLQAEKIQGKNKMHDASAASIILQSYLDKKNKNSWYISYFVYVIISAYEI